MDRFVSNIDAAARLQGARLDPGFLPLGARPRWLRRPLLLSGARSACDRCRRECADGGDRGVDRGAFRRFRKSASNSRWRSTAPARRLKIDGEGRVMLSETLKSHAGITEAVAFVGLGHKFQIWEPGRFRASSRRPPQKVRALKSELGSQVGGAQRARSTGMTAGGDGFAAVAGGPARHIPVLGRPALEFLNVHDGGVYIDATFGAGGYSRAILARRRCTVIGIDRDRRRAGARAPIWSQAARPADAGRGSLLQSRRQWRASTASTAVDGVVLDLGVSSMQLDTPERGFSFRLDGPLDMRMGGEGPSAADVVDAASERDLANIIFILGEERHSRAVARAIVGARARRRSPPRTALADIVASRRARRGPATSIRPPARSRRCAFSSTTNWANSSTRACRRRARAQAGRPAGGGVVPFARGPHRQDLPRSSAAQTRAGSRHVPRGRAPGADLPAADQAAGHRRRGGDRRQSARPLGQAARRRAHARRRRAPTMPPHCCRVCRRSPTC